AIRIQIPQATIRGKADRLRLVLVGALARRPTSGPAGIGGADGDVVKGGPRVVHARVGNRQCARHDRRPVAKRLAPAILGEGGRIPVAHDGRRGGRRAPKHRDEGRHPERAVHEKFRHRRTGDDQREHHQRSPSHSPKDSPRAGHSANSTAESLSAGWGKSHTRPERFGQRKESATLPGTRVHFSWTGWPPALRRWQTSRCGRRISSRRSDEERPEREVERIRRRSLMLYAFDQPPSEPFPVPAVKFPPDRVMPGIKDVHTPPALTRSYASSKRFCRAPLRDVASPGYHLYGARRRPAEGSAAREGRAVDRAG